MALGDLRKAARINAIRTASENIRSYGEEGSTHEDHCMSELEFELFQEECKKLSVFLAKKANKLQFS
tara:strand:- start:67 stop:267 length:201 start_codon:yes stop_codon:yes gene_type:complete